MCDFKEASCKNQQQEVQHQCQHLSRCAASVLLSALDSAVSLQLYPKTVRHSHLYMHSYTIDICYKGLHFTVENNWSNYKYNFIKFNSSSGLILHGRDELNPHYILSSKK